MMDEPRSDVEELDKGLELIKNTEEKFGTMFSEISRILKSTKHHLSKLDYEKEILTNEKVSLEREKNEINKEKEKLRHEKEQKEEQLVDITGQQKKLLKEYEILKQDLKKFQDLASEAENQEFNFKEIQNLLKIYAVLITEIWGGQPHYRILNLLHGDKERMSREDIKNATGISGAMVLRSLHDLRQSNLIEYDDETGKAVLIKRLFPKESEKERE